MSDKDIVTVCSRCLRASCWQGVFMCDAAIGAGTRQMTVAQLRKGDYGEHESWWDIDPATGCARHLNNHPSAETIASVTKWYEEHRGHNTGD